jgi:hypothetical protein
VFAFGNSSARLCQGVTRREWLRVGGLSSMGLMLPELLRADRRAKERGGFLRSS